MELEIEKLKLKLAPNNFKWICVFAAICVAGLIVYAMYIA